MPRNNGGGGGYTLEQPADAPIPAASVAQWPPTISSFAATGALALAVAATAVPGLTQTVNNPATTARPALVCVTWDFSQGVAGSGILIGELSVAGVVQTPQGLLSEVAGIRATVTQQYALSLAAGNTQLIVLGRKLNAAGTANANNPHTTMTVAIFA